MRVLGIDLAWGDTNESGVVAVDQSGQVLDAGWTVGIDDTVRWMQGVAQADTLALVDAPLAVTNETGQRGCEQEVGKRYGRWKVSANSTNLRSPRLGGVKLRELLEAEDWVYQDGRAGPPTSGLVLSECYPYTTLVGAAELGYDVERPRYKRKPKAMSVAEFRPLRAAACDDLIRRLANLDIANPSLDLSSHPVTARLAEEPSPCVDRAYKHREDLIDAVLCAWTALLWLAHGTDRCQVLGHVDGPITGLLGTIIAPARLEQRRPV